MTQCFVYTIKDNGIFSFLSSSLKLRCTVVTAVFEPPRSGVRKSDLGYWWVWKPSVSMSVDTLHWINAPIILPETPLFTGLGSDKHLFILWLRLHHPHHHLQRSVLFDGARSEDVSVTGPVANSCTPSCDRGTHTQWQQVQMLLYIPWVNPRI